MVNRTYLSLALLSAAGLVYGQSTTATTTLSTSATATSSSASKTYTVSVGKLDHKMDPDVTTANVGDIVEFQFYPTNHSVIRAEYGYPCVPYELTGKNKVGFWSGFKPVDTILDDPPSYSVRINDTLPIFFYCSAPGSCINYQMVGVINPNKSVSLDVQKQKAKDSSYVLSPGESFPAEASSSMASLTAAATGAAATSTSSAGASPAATSHGLGTGAIVGIVVGAVAILALAAALFFFIGRTKTLKQTMNRQSATVTTRPPQHDPEMYQTEGGLYLPVKPENYRRTSNMSAWGNQEVPPYQLKSPDTEVHEVQSLHMMSPRAPTWSESDAAMYAQSRMGSPPPMTPPPLRVPPKQTAPAELYAPLPGAEQQHIAEMRDRKDSQ